MLLAEIEAQDLNDLQAAAIVVERFISQPGHSSANIVYALNSMADWHLKYAQDRDAAEACFRRIIELLPDSEWSMLAEQRIAHLVGYEQMLAGRRSHPIQVPHIEGDPGLGGGLSIAKPAEEDVGAQAAKYVKHLEQFPYDTEIREQLAQLYGEHFHRLDLASDQLEQLVQFPNQPRQKVVKWLNMLADLQVKFGGTYDAARAALERIIELYPDTGAANLAQNRVELLVREFKAREKSQTVTLGSYEDDLGLKGKLPHQL
jgi:tetratricopeptide (TPR) repeat protein